jgi:hypothetical protein
MSCPREPVRSWPGIARLTVDETSSTYIPERLSENSNESTSKARRQGLKPFHRLAIAPIEIEMSSTTASTPVFIEPTDTRTATASQVATSAISDDDPLSNPDTSKIVKVTIACAIMVLLVTGAVAGFKVSFQACMLRSIPTD